MSRDGRSTLLGLRLNADKPTLGQSAAGWVTWGRFFIVDDQAGARPRGRSRLPTHGVLQETLNEENELGEMLLYETGSVKSSLALDELVEERAILPSQIHDLLEEHDEDKHQVSALTRQELLSLSGSLRGARMLNDLDWYEHYTS